MRPKVPAKLRPGVVGMLNYLKKFALDVVLSVVAAILEN